MNDSLSNKRALVLGVSAPNSIGFAIADQLQAAGAAVMIAGRDEEKTAECAQALGCEFSLCDITSGEQLQALADSAVEKLGGLDIAVNCTGVAAPSSIARVREAEARRAVDVMLLGTLFFVQKMAAAIARDGSIISLSSITASRPMASNAAYISAKAGADHLIRSAALEFGAKNIKVNSVSPGFTDDTPMTRDFLQVEGLRQVFEKEIPLGRLNTPVDVAAAVVWLCQESSFLTGQNLQVNGGHSLNRMPSGADLAALY